MLKNALLLAMVAAPAGLMAAESITVRAAATIVVPISVDENTTMNFGTILLPLAGGGAAAPAAAPIPVRLPSDGSGRVLGAGLVAGPNVGHNPSFRVRGRAGLTFTVDRIAPFNLDRRGTGGVGAGNSMQVTVDEVRCRTGAGLLGGATVHTIQANNEETIALGATLLVNPDQNPGVYEQNYDVTVRYN